MQTLVILFIMIHLHLMSLISLQTKTVYSTFLLYSSISRQAIIDPAALCRRIRIIDAGVSQQWYPQQSMEATTQHRDRQLCHYPGSYAILWYRHYRPATARLLDWHHQHRQRRHSRQELETNFLGEYHWESINLGGWYPGWTDLSGDAEDHYHSIKAHAAGWG